MYDICDVLTNKNRRTLVPLGVERLSVCRFIRHLFVQLNKKEKLKKKKNGCKTAEKDERSWRTKFEYIGNS
jgi:hypothetical protein